MPAKLLIDNINVCARYNDSVLHCTFSDLLKMADITPAHKIITDLLVFYLVYQNILNVSCIIKFESLQKNIYQHTYVVFRKGYCAEYCLISLWKVKRQ